MLTHAVKNTQCTCLAYCVTTKFSSTFSQCSNILVVVLDSCPFCSKSVTIEILFPWKVTQFDFAADLRHSQTNCKCILKQKVVITIWSKVIKLLIGQNLRLLFFHHYSQVTIVSCLIYIITIVSKFKLNTMFKTIKVVLLKLLLWYWDLHFK